LSHHIQAKGRRSASALLEAESWWLSGDRVREQAALQKALKQLQAQLVEQPHNPDSWSAQAIALAGLGARDDALAAARRATEIVPISRDALDGVLYTTVLARV
jgi:tetratricopeptide (TPR) repeat protein